MLTGYKILVAEDNSLNQKIATFLLEKDGAEVTIVFNGLEAVQQLEERTFDVVLMDLQMPEMDGYETASHIRNVLKIEIPIIALSASNFDDEVKKCHESGMNACITKPIDIHKLNALILELKQDQKIIA